MEKEVLIEIKNLTVNVYHKDSKGNKNIQNVYKNFNYKIFKGDRLIFIDNNGSGKSLLFDLLFCGLNNYIQTKGDGIDVEGEIIYKGKNILIPDENERRPFCHITQDDPIRTNSTVLSMIESDCVANNIDINNDDCRGQDCQKCVIACPNNVLTKEGDDTMVRNPLTCKHCKVCEAICPNDCILVN